MNFHDPKEAFAVFQMKLPVIVDLWWRYQFNLSGGVLQGSLWMMDEQQAVEILFIGAMAPGPESQGGHSQRNKSKKRIKKLFCERLKIWNRSFEWQYTASTDTKMYSFFSDLYWLLVPIERTLAVGVNTFSSFFSHNNNTFIHHRKLQ